VFARFDLVSRGTDSFNNLISTWHIITGEYPPQLGGVSDYTEQVATGLANNKCDVHIWCPGTDTERMSRPGITEHHFGENFYPRNLLRLGRSLDGVNAPRTLLVQYAPNAFGLRGLNLPFCCWLWWRSLICRDDVRVMFHEPYFYFAWQSPQRNLLALVNRLMAAVLLAASHVVYISIPAWGKMLSPYAWLRRPPIKWLPIPATIPRVEDSEAVALIRERIENGQDGKMIVGHFGTYGDHITPVLAQVFLKLLDEHPNVLGLCLGARGEKFVGDIVAEHPRLKGRLIAPGYLSSEAVSLHLQACDFAIQPYPDGVSSRRTSLMAALINGTPTITNTGQLTEKLWSEAGIVPLASEHDARALLVLAMKILMDAGFRQKIGEQEQVFYREHFSLERTVRTLSEFVRPDTHG